MKKQSSPVFKQLLLLERYLLPSIGQQARSDDTRVHVCMLLSIRLLFFYILMSLGGPRYVFMSH